MSTIDYVLCINNESNPISLIVGKVYRTVPDEESAAYELIRVLDETTGEPGSEDGYLYPVAMFVPIELPEIAMRALEMA